MTPDEYLEVDIEEVKPEGKQRLEHTPYSDARGCTHVFERETETTVKCTKPGCGLGLFVNPTDRIENGKLIHIY